jgi:hypothetical protein
MSPTATIATVIAALILLAWLFQSPTYDPGYEAWRKRQAEQQKEDESRRVVAGAVVTDPKVVVDARSLDEIRMDQQREHAWLQGSGGGSAQASIAAPILGGEGADPNVDPFKYGVAVTVGAPGTGAPIDPTLLQKIQEQQGRTATFGNNQLLSGTYVAVTYAAASDGVGKNEESSITFRRDGSFATQNMGAADVDMEAATALGTSVDRGAGRYKISGSNLELTYTDGLDRKKGPRRTYVIKPVAGSEDAPIGITIQGKLFKLESRR